MISQRLRFPKNWRRPPLRAASTVAVAFVSNVQAATTQIHANARGAALGRNHEYLHQLRVGIRRLRSTLRAFRKLVRGRRARQFDREFRSLLRSMGAVRDWDAFLLARLQPALRAAAQKQRAMARMSLRKAVASRKLTLLTGRALVWAQSEPWRASARPDERVGPFGARALQRLFEAVPAAAAGIDWSAAQPRPRGRIPGN